MGKNIQKGTKGITLIALIITIIVLLILAGVTIAQLTGSDSAPAKANEAKQKDAIGSMKDEISIFAQNKQMEAYNDVYVGNGATAGGAKAAVGQYVINALKNEYKSPNDVKRGVTISISQTGTEDAEIVLTTTDWKQKGTVEYQGGVLTWKTLEANTGSSVNTGGNDPTDDPPAPATVDYDGLTSEEEALLTTNNMEELTVAEIEANVDATSGLDADEKTARKTALEDTTKIKTVLTGNTPVPKGYTYLEGTSTDATSAGTNGWGVVIKDGNDNEFVWVPVPDAKVLYDEIEGSGTEVGSTEESSIHLAGVKTWEKVASINDIPSLQVASTGVNATKKSKSGILGSGCDTGRGNINNTSGYREPALVTDYDLSSDYYTQAGFASAQAMAQAFVTDYNNMIESIAKYGGFYVGRYELSALWSEYDGDGNKINVSEGEGSYSALDVDETGAISSPKIQAGYIQLDNINWYRLYQACRKFNSNNTTSTMMWGCQWDILCSWGATKGDQVSYSEYDSDRHTDHYEDTTGSNSNDIRNNVYDLEGSRYEWTQEAYNTDAHIFRGGSYGYDGAGNYNGAGYYDVYQSGWHADDLGSRATLYIK